MAILNVQKQNQLDWEYNVNLTTDFGQKQNLTLKMMNKEVW